MIIEIVRMIGRSGAAPSQTIEKGAVKTRMLNCEFGCYEIGLHFLGCLNKELNGHKKAQKAQKLFFAPFVLFCGEICAIACRGGGG
jgi:hypothetical protein